LSLATFDASYFAEYTALARSSIRAATRDALGQLARQVGDPGWLREILVVDMNHAPGHEQVARAAEFFSMGDFQRAYWYLDVTVAKSPSYQPGLCYYGAAIARLGRPAEARMWLERAVAIDPGTLEAESARQWMDTIHQSAGP